MKKIAFISDVFFSFFVGSLFTLCFFRFLRLTFWLSVFLSAFCGGLTAFSAWAILSSKRNRLFLKKSDEAEKEKLLFHLALLSDKEKTDFFQNVLSKTNPTQRVGHLRLSSPTEFFFLHFKLSSVTPDDVANYARLKTAKQKILLCSTIPDEVLPLCERLHIDVRSGTRVYDFLKTENALPENYLGEEDPSTRHKHRFRLCFSKNNAKRFLLCGGLILLSSFLTPFPFYYIVFGAILLFTAVFVRIFGRQ
ncbi:MAG: hypothetical protein IJY05_02190 [Clostridia bacterium]|nr:hypothetical protein [Clostridia bacterium]